jgi:hypothetical protein
LDVDGVSVLARVASTHQVPVFTTMRAHRRRTTLNGMFPSPQFPSREGVVMPAASCQLMPVRRPAVSAAAPPHPDRQHVHRTNCRKLAMHARYPRRIMITTVLAVCASSGIAVATASPPRSTATTPNACIIGNGGDYNACNIGNSGRGDLPYAPVTYTG